MKEEVYIVRAILKISSALTNLDELYCDVAHGDCNEHFKGKFYRDFNKFCEFFEHHTREMVIAMAESDLEAVTDVVYYHLNLIDEDTNADSDELLQIGLLLAKLKSALKDLKKVDLKSLTNRLVVDPLIGRLSTITTKPYIKKLPIDFNGLNKLVCRVDTDIENVILE